MKLNVMQMTDVTGRGGAEKALVDLALRLDRSRFNVTVCATRTAGNYQPVLDAAGVRTVILDRNSRTQSYKMLHLLALMRRERIHVLHTHLFGANTWGRILGKLAGVPVIVSHEHWSSRSTTEVRIDRRLYRLSDRILVPSYASKRLVMQLEDLPPELLDVAYNGVDISQFSPDTAPANRRAELGTEEGSIVVGTVGRLSADKGGQDDLLRAFTELRKWYPAVRLLVVGDGPLRAGLEKLAGELGEADFVTFTGARTDVAKLLGAMDVFVLPSLREALPIAVLEAMAMGLPVVATNVGGVPEVVQSGTTGLLYEPGDRAALNACLAQLLSQPDLMQRLGQAGRCRVHEHFTVAKTVEHIEQLYLDLARQKHII